MEKEKDTRKIIIEKGAFRYVNFDGFDQAGERGRQVHRAELPSCATQHSNAWTWDAKDIDILIGWALDGADSVTVDGTPVDPRDVARIVIEKLTAAGRTKVVEALEKRRPAVWRL